MTALLNPSEGKDHSSETVSARKRFSSVISHLARELDDRADASSPRGEIALLRRQDGALSPAFYKFAARTLEEVLAPYASEPILVEAERRWARVVQSLAVLGGQHRLGGLSFGSALASSDFAEMRLLRLLRADAGSIDAALRAAVAPLGQKALVFDMFDLAALVLSAPHPTYRFHFQDGEEVRRRIARDYYRNYRKTEDAEGAQS